MKQLIPSLVVLTTLVIHPLTQGEMMWPTNHFETGWSGQQAQAAPAPDAKTPDGEPVVRWTWTRVENTMPTWGRGFEPTALRGDVLGFWFRTDKPFERLNIVLQDADDVGAEQSVPALMNTPRIEPGRWHYIVWPFRLQPGWVRYSRAVIDWNRIKGITLLTWHDQLNPNATIEIGPFHAMTFAELEGLFEKHPDHAGTSRSLPWRVLTDEKYNRMYRRYHESRAEQMIAELRKKYPPAKFIRAQEEIRKRLAATYLMPEVKGAPEATHVRDVQLDGITVEHQLLKIRDGVYSTAQVYVPPSSISPPLGGEGKSEGNRSRRPAIFMLPGHGDPCWSGSVQNRCLSFAKRGYLVMLVQPFGQNQRGDVVGWNESHDAQSTAFLLPTGQGLMGIIMSDHRAELTYLLSRPDVDPKRVAVTGVSMGGTHSVWFAAIDKRLAASVPDACAASYLPFFSGHHMGQCDLMFGAYKVADQQMIYGLIAPRPLLEIYPASQAPLTDEGWRLFSEGKISIEDAEKKYARNDAQMAEFHRFSRDVYDLFKVPQNYVDLIVAGPHDYTKAMRENAAGFIAVRLDSTQPSAAWQPIPEAPLSPITNRVEAVNTLNFWPDNKRPPEVLSPTAYVQRETSRLIAQLPPPPNDLRSWQKMRGKLQTDVRDRLAVPLDPPHATLREVGKARAENGAIHKLVVQPEPGIDVPMLLFEPEDGVQPSGQLVVLLHPSGMTQTACCEERAGLTRAGAWVLCVDLRGMGETRYAGESGGYVGFHDYDIAMMALKLGETLAGYWTKDLLAAIVAAKKIVAASVSERSPVARARDSKLRVTVRAENETGLVAILAAGQSDAIDAVETKGLLASYYSEKGYGLPFAYSDENNSKAVRNRKLGGYGTMIPCIPNILKHADIAQLAALVAPRSLTISDPLWASGDRVSTEEMEKSFAWTRQVYAISQSQTNLLFFVNGKALSKIGGHEHSQANP